jgi:hypothetical protein
MVLDYYDATEDGADLQRYLPMAVAVVEAYRQRFPNTDPKTGRTDMWYGARFWTEGFIRGCY